VVYISQINLLYMYMLAHRQRRKCTMPHVPKKLVIGSIT